MSDDYTKDMADTIAYSHHLLAGGPFNTKKYARILFNKGDRPMFELPKKEDKVGKLIKIQSDLIGEMYQERLDKQGLIDPAPLRRKIVSNYTIKEAMSGYKHVIGATLEEAIDNLMKRDKERGKETDQLKEELRFKNGDVAGLNKTAALLSEKLKSSGELVLKVKASATIDRARLRKFRQLVTDNIKDVSKAFKLYNEWIIEQDKEQAKKLKASRGNK